MSVEEKVLAFVRTWADDEVTLDSRIVHDLGIWGDDYDEFFTDYAGRFSVDIGEAVVGPFTPSEGYPLIDFDRLLRRPPKRYIPVTVRDLVRMAEVGSADESGVIADFRTRAPEPLPPPPPAPSLPWWRKLLGRWP